MKYEPFFLLGHPKPKGSWTPLYTKSGKIKFRPASNLTAVWCASAMKQIIALWKGPLLACPIKTEFQFLIPRPKTVTRPYPTSRFDGDIDKLVRGLLDAMTGVVYVDDSQVVRSCEAQDYTDGQPGVWVTISTDL